MLSPERPVASGPQSADPPASPTAGFTARRQTDRPLGDRVRSLSLSRMPERRSALGSTVVWIVALATLAGASYYAYTKFASKLAADGVGDPGAPSSPTPA